MTKVNAILDQRMKKSSNSTKMMEMANQSTKGNLTSFSGIFNVVELSENEKSALSEILTHFADDHQDIRNDLSLLISITSEVRAITNQAALLHGERIKKVHHMLTKYRDGAFTAWLMAAYGNRQTPYNLMQYYEFCEVMPKTLRPKIELMPRQVVYVLASREGSLEQKQQIVENYQGETKAEMLSRIREIFPLNERDRRHSKVSSSVIQELNQIYRRLKNIKTDIPSKEKKQIVHLLHQVLKIVEKS